MKTVIRYQAVDGALYTNEKECAAHNEDCIGEEFDALLLAAIQATGGHVTRNDQYKMCLHLLKNRHSVLPALKNLVAYIEDADAEESEA